MILGNLNISIQSKQKKNIKFLSLFQSIYLSSLDPRFDLNEINKKKF